MGESLLTTLSMENLHPSTLLSMDPSGGAPPPAVASSASASAHDDCDRELMIQQRQQMVLPGPPDINLPLSAERSPPPQLWSSDPCDILDVGLAPQIYETEAVLNLPKAGCSATAVAAAAGARKCAKRGDSIWGAWFFFNFYFRPVLSKKSKGYGFLMQWMTAVQIPPCRSEKPTTAQIQNYHHCLSRSAAARSPSSSEPLRLVPPPPPPSEPAAAFDASCEPPLPSRSWSHPLLIQGRDYPDVLPHRLQHPIGLNHG